MMAPIQYFGSVEYYAAIAARPLTVVNDLLRFNKRFKTTHRLTIADTHGEITLTVPVSYPRELKVSLTWNDMLISDHGNWGHVIFETLASAYGRTPFFEFYIDRLRPFFDKTTPHQFSSIADLCRAAHEAVCRILQLEGRTIYSSQLPKIETVSEGLLIPHLSASDIAPTGKPTLVTPWASTTKEIATVPYYQVRSHRHGFIPGLSVLDLIFNLGPEATLHLDRMHRGPV